MIKAIDNIGIYNFQLIIPIIKMGIDKKGQFVTLNEINDIILDNWNISINYEYEEPLTEEAEASYSGVAISIYYISTESKTQYEKPIRDKFKISEPYPLSIFLNVPILPEQGMSLYFFGNGDFECGSYSTMIKE